ncbi:mycofactocin-coupled SDR family oxidoreductase [Blastococcus sp. TF02A-26]|uniref:mycofactocin-coupled SDR family oxidoreductase n=1 Tax=Blastococcus sp. TF02A-26 TaxID=2250577 RepID=UPI000DEAC597|nr:mycofactocin-coupled SDR family oxidoreductase [Blastococcus sp. TF02A-26]RBY83146.1 SDR family mycofactocin-dependent oxidoreductase [Blastococcus sp. TF02A-26]
MAGRVEGKVAFITGAAHGQGRSHAIRLAQEGADIIAVDLCQDYDTVGYPMGTEEELDQTVKSVEALDRRAVKVVADVRDPNALKAAFETGIAELGHVDVICANAGIAAYATEQTRQHYIDVLNVNLVGVINTVMAGLPHLPRGGSIIVTGSLAALLKGGLGSGSAYTLAKRSLVPFVQTTAAAVANEMIRVNGVHPTNCNTNLLQNDDLYKLFRPDLENPTKEDATPAFMTLQQMPVPWIEPEDISEMVLFLASDASRYVTGQFIAVDAGGTLKTLE